MSMTDAAVLSYSRGWHQGYAAKLKGHNEPSAVDVEQELTEALVTSWSCWFSGWQHGTKAAVDDEREVIS